jgi:hypothetical protein
MRPTGLLLIAAGVAASSPVAAKPRKVELSFTSGVNYSTGDYGTRERTRTVGIPLSVRARRGPVRVTARMPYLFRNGSRQRLDEEGQIISGPSATIGESRRGFGDLTLGLGYSLPQIAKGVEVDVGSSLRLPTSKNSNGFGSGKTDVSFSGDVAFPQKRFTPFAGIGYRIRGDRPDFRLRNTINTSLGSSFRFGKANAALSYEYSQASTGFRSDAHSLFASLGRRVNRGLYVSGFGSTGLSKGAADFSTGISFTARTR